MDSSLPTWTAREVVCTTLLDMILSPCFESLLVLGRTLVGTLPDTTLAVVAGDSPCDTLDEGGPSSLGLAMYL